MNYFNLIIFIITLDYIIEQVLAFVNIRYQRQDIPNNVAEFYDKEKYNKSLQYHKELTKAEFLSSSFSTLLTLALFIFGGLGWLDSILRNFTERSIPLALIFFGVLLLAFDLVMIPFKWYRTFVIEERFGFNTKTIKTFIKDKLIEYLIAAIVGGIVCSILIFLILSFGPGFWIWFTIILSIIVFFIGAYFSTLILPLFNRLTPLPEGELKSAILDYSNKVNFPIENVFIMDGSKRSTKSNAFFSGFGKKKKIILYDTLIQNHTIEELIAILAHEVGHYKKRHVIIMYLFMIIQIGVFMYLFSLTIFNGTLSLALGGPGTAIHLNLLAFAVLTMPLSHVMNLIGHMISRRNEFQADAYSKQTFDGPALSTAMKKLSVDNLSNLYPHPLYVFFHYSHPPLLRRLKAIEAFR